MYRPRLYQQSSSLATSTVLIELFLDLWGIWLGESECHESGLALSGALSQLVNVCEFSEPLVVQDLLQLGSLVTALLKQLYLKDTHRLIYKRIMVIVVIRSIKWYVVLTLA